jgi:rhodanese-related sulfurtransferase
MKQSPTMWMPVRGNVVTSSVNQEKSVTIPIRALFIVMMLPFLASAAETPRILSDDLRRAQLTHEASLVIVDVRTPADFGKGHIQGARNLPSAVIAGAGLARDQHLVLYCGEDPCALTSGAADRLVAAAYQHVEILKGGFGAWVAKGYPVEGGTSATSINRAHRVSSKETYDRITNGSALPLDVRVESEFKAGHLPGARNAPLEQFDAEMARLDKAREIIVYDRDPARALVALGKLTAAGFKATELPGGLPGWVKRKMPLEIK